MKKEIDNAVETFHRIAFGTKKNGTKYISESKLSCFISVLTELLFVRYEKNWYPENPDRGSGYRCIRVNTQSVDPTVQKSLKKAEIGLAQMVGATELTIWVDPGVVSVRIGEDGSIGTEIVDEEVYNLRRRKPEVRLEKSDSVETQTSSSRSSSPEMDRSLSGSPSFVSSQPPRSSPIPEYNPYCPPARVNYPMRFQSHSSTSPPRRAITSPPHHNAMSTPPPKSVSPIRGFSSPMAARASHGHIAATGSPVPISFPDSCSMSQGNIPLHQQQQQRVANYSRPRAIFPSTPYSSDQGIDKLSSRASLSPYSMLLNNGHGMPSPNMYDIPAMA